MSCLVYNFPNIQFMNVYSIPVYKYHSHDEEKESPQYNDPNKVPLMNKQFMTSAEEQFREEIRKYPISRE